MPQRSHLPFRPLAALAALIFVVACQSGNEGSDGAAEPAPTAPPAFRPATAEAEAEPAAEPAAEATTHVVATEVVRTTDGGAELVTTIEPRGGYHLNTDLAFPWRVKVADDAPVAAGTTLRGQDARRLEEARAEFTIPVDELADGTGVAGEVVIGVCDDEGCVRVREEVAWMDGAE